MKEERKISRKEPCFGIRGAVILVILAVTLCACTKGGAGANGLTGEENGDVHSTVDQGRVIGYENTAYELQGDLLALMDARFAGEYLYYRELDEKTGCYGIERICAENGKRETYLRADAFLEEGWEEEAAAGEFIVQRSMRSFDVTKDGGAMALVACYDKENPYGVNGIVKDWMLMEFDAFGNCLNLRPLESGLMPEDAFGPKLGVDGEGNVFLVLSKQFILLDKQGGKLAEYPIEEGCFVRDLIRGNDGKLMFAMSNNKGEYQAWRVNFDKKTLEEIDGLPDAMTGLGCIWKDGGKGEYEDYVLAYTADALFQCQVAKKEETELTRWSESGVFGPKLYAAAMYGDWIMALSTANGTNVELAVLKPIVEEKEQTGGKIAGGEVETITLGVLIKWSIMDRIVADYNRSQKKYKVVIREYGELRGEGAIDFQEPANRMMMDVLGENAPDLLELTPILNSYGNLSMSAEDMLDKGYVVDLQGYLEASSVIGRESFEQKILEAYTYDKGLPAIPTSYVIQTLGVSRKELGKRFGWTFSELMAYDKAHPEKVVMTNASSKGIYSLCLAQNLDAFVNLEEGTVCFDCPEFREILEYAHTYPTPKGGEVVSLYDEEGLVRIENIDALLDIQSLPNLQFDGEGQFIGYPTMDGRPYSILRGSSDAVSLGMCATSDHKEGAWDFIEYVLSHDFTAGLSDVSGVSTFGGIPTNKEFLEKQWKALRNDDVDAPLNHMQLGNTAGGVKYDTHPFTQEEVDEFYTLLNSAVSSDPRMDRISGIVLEELQPYFVNQKSMDQVIEVIQNRVQLFLNEK